MPSSSWKHLETPRVTKRVYERKRSVGGPRRSLGNLGNASRLENLVPSGLLVTQPEGRQKRPGAQQRAWKQIRIAQKHSRRAEEQRRTAREHSRRASKPVHPGWVSGLSCFPPGFLCSASGLLFGFLPLLLLLCLALFLSAAVLSALLLRSPAALLLLSCCASQVLLLCF